LFAGDPGDAIARFIDGHVAPSTAGRRQFLMKLAKDFMHERAGLAGIHLESIAFAGAQPGLHEKLKGTGGELFKPAGRRSQPGTVERGDRLGRQPVGTIGLRALPQMLQPVAQGIGLQEFHHRSGIRSRGQQTARQFPRVKALFQRSGRTE
jgi:hypothetical protein